MKKTILCLILTGLFLGCEPIPPPESNTRYFNTSIDIGHAELTKDNVTVATGQIVGSNDLRIKLFCNFLYENRNSYKDDPDGTNPERFQENVGLKHRLLTISITCDKKIANIEAGENLVTYIPMRVWVDDTTSFSIGKWQSILNTGSEINWDYGFRIEPYIHYEFDIEFFPFYVTVAEDEYIFTVMLGFGGAWDYGTNGHVYEHIFTETFPPVHLK